MIHVTVEDMKQLLIQYGRVQISMRLKYPYKVNTFFFTYFFYEWCK